LCMFFGAFAAEVFGSAQQNGAGISRAVNNS
jgi:hypothetical protein